MNTASALDNGIGGPARWSLHLLGGLDLSVLPGGERVALSGKRERVLLAYLALSPNGRQQRRKLTTLLWGDAADETTLDNLRHCLWGLRKAFGDTEHRLIASEGEEIVLDAASFEVDVLALRRHTAQLGRSDLGAAVDLYGGDFLDGLDIESEEFESWRRTEATRCRNQAIDILSRLMTQADESGENERAIQAAEQILRLEPLHEATVRLLMRHHGESGRRGVAVQLYRTLADSLRTELNAQPEAKTRLALAQIAHGGEEGPNSPAAAIAEPARSTSMVRTSEAAAAPLPLPARPVSRLRAPLMILAATLIAATALISYGQFARVAAPDGVVAERLSFQQASVISIAVLPFVNLSSDAEQEFFSDGMTEEITAALAKVPNLRVVARTSAYQFKGQNQDLRVVGQGLGATHLIEGSVRTVGDRVRITAQLIKVDDATHLWTENYDRELTDIFKIQEDIARAIAGALRVPLGLAPGGSLISNRAIDPDSYQQYLHAKALLQVQGSGAEGVRALSIMELLVVRNPDYAPAWALLAAARGAAIIRTIRSRPIDEALRVREELEPKQEAAARRAIELDPNLADGYLALSAAGVNRQNLVLREDLISKALALDPYNQTALGSYGNLLAGVGRLKEALAARQQLRAVEPFVPSSNSNFADSLWLDGQNDAAVAILKDTPGWIPHAETARIYASMGRYSEAAAAELEITSMNVRPSVVATAKEAARLVRTAPAKYPSPQDLPRLVGRGHVYLHIGAPDRALEDIEKEGEAGFFSLASISTLWHPSYAPVRKTERFKAHVRKAGLVDYWRARGWPEFCRPQGADDFVCV